MIGNTQHGQACSDRATDKHQLPFRCFRPDNGHRESRAVEIDAVGCPGCKDQNDECAASQSEGDHIGHWVNQAGDHGGEHSHEHGKEIAQTIAQQRGGNTVSCGAGVP